MSLGPYRLLVALCLLTALGAPRPALAHHHAQHTPPLLQHVDFEQRLQAFIPLDLVFRDETGRPVSLGDYFSTFSAFSTGTRPVILTLVYYDCPNLCTLVLNGLLRTLRALSLTVGENFQVLTVSIDPQDTPALAAARRAQYLRAYNRPAAADGWHFLTGSPEAIQTLAQAVGFRYTYDASRDEFAHASGIMVLTPQGQLARYFYGVEYAPRDVRLGLVEAAAQKIGSPMDRLLLLCYHYDPASGTYTPVILRTLRVAGVATILAVGMFMGAMVHRERRRKARPTERK
jgi:protein SCO1/2